MTPIAVAGLVLTTDAAFAKSEKKPKKEKRARKDRSANHGALASELKNLNAAHSLKNGQGYVHASMNSNIGMIATYGFAEYAIGDAEALLAAYVDGFYPKDAYDCYDALDAFTCTDGTQGAVDAEILEYETLIDSPEYISALNIFKGAVTSAEGDSQDAFDALGLGDLSDPALDYFNTLLSYGEFSVERLSKSDGDADDEFVALALDF